MAYLAEVYQELRKVVWPTWPELWRMTGIVIVTVAAIGTFLGLVDLALSRLFVVFYAKP